MRANLFTGLFDIDIVPPDERSMVLRTTSLIIRSRIFLPVVRFLFFAFTRRSWEELSFKVFNSDTHGKYNELYEREKYVDMCVTFTFFCAVGRNGIIVKRPQSITNRIFIFDLTRFHITLNLL
jgi:hypothetical protein